MINGAVMAWNSCHGWRFIKGDDGEKCYLHVSKIRTYHSVINYSRVKYDIIQRQQDPMAVDVTFP